MEWIKNGLLVALGGALGSLLRYSAGTWSGPGHFPWPTWVVNVGGCLLIGLLFGWAHRYAWLEAEGRWLLMTGFCGGLTTFSAFALENFRLLQAGDYKAWALYTAASVLAALGAVAAGFTLVR